MTKIHHRIVTVLKSPLVAFGILPKPKTKPVITVPAAKSANIAAHIWEDHVYATHEPKPTPPPSRLILSETDEVAMPIPYERVTTVPKCEHKPVKSARIIAAEREFRAYLDDLPIPTAAKRKATKPTVRAKAKARSKAKVKAKATSRKPRPTKSK